MKIFGTILCLLSLGWVSCFHIESKTEILKRIGKWQQQDLHLVVVDSGTMIKVLVRDSNFQHLDQYYHFDEDGAQHKYSVRAYCDSCFRKYLSNTLHNPGFQWKPLNDSTYLSAYRLKRALNIHPAQFSYDIVQYDLSRLEYRIVLRKGKK